LVVLAEGRDVAGIVAEADAAAADVAVADEEE